MKVTKYIVIAGILASSTIAATYAMTAPEPTPKVQQSAITKPVSTKTNSEPVAKAAEPTTQTTATATEPVPQPVIQPAPAPTPPPLLTAQQYAEQYLDLSGINQTCFNEILKNYPSRFVESVREANVKALRAFGTVCSTGIPVPEWGNRSMSNMLDIGADRHLVRWSGVFFDSELAAKFH